MSDFSAGPILVTGAGGGIGSALVLQLAAAGAEVIAAERSLDMLAWTSAISTVRTLRFDLDNETSIREALKDLDVWGVVNCAGLGGVVAPTLETDAAVFDQVMAVNARGALLVIKHAAAAMVRAGRGGSIVNVASQASLVALEGHASYGASKAALDSITRAAALELGRYRIRVNSVNPTVVMTPMSASYWGRPGIEGPFLKRMPLGRWATEDEIAAPIRFLLSDDASMITGVSLPVDGGYTCQ